MPERESPVSREMALARAEELDRFAREIDRIFETLDRGHSAKPQGDAPEPMSLRIRQAADLIRRMASE